MRALAVFAFLFGVTLTCGALGDPFLSTEVPFSALERENFDAIGVLHESDSPSAEALLVHVRLLGDPAPAALAEAFAWLEEHANIRVVEDPEGAPLYLTAGDLAATSGRGTLGATVPEGMAIEVRDPRIAPCVIAHEMLHFVGLKHVNDRSNIMYPHCSRDFLQGATLNDAQLDQLATLGVIRATTPSGVHVWASR